MNGRSVNAARRGVREWAQCTKFAHGFVVVNWFAGSEMICATWLLGKLPGVCRFMPYGLLRPWRTELRVTIGIHRARRGDERLAEHLSAVDALPPFVRARAAIVVALDLFEIE